MAGAATELSTLTNNAGGTLGGISSGGNLVFKVAVKPVSTIGRAQETATCAALPASWPRVCCCVAQQQQASSTGTVPTSSSLASCVCVFVCACVGGRYQGAKTTLEAKGRHDPCVLPRTPPLVEGVALGPAARARARVPQSRRPNSANMPPPPETLNTIIVLKY